MKPSRYQRLPLDKNALRDTDPLQLVNRKFLQDSIDLWDRALNTTIPTQQEEVEDSIFYVSFDEVLTAPKGDGEEIQPVEVYTYDGVRPITEADLELTLDILTTQVIRKDIPVRVNDNIRPETLGVQRVYVFSESVQEALQVQGRLLTVDANGNPISWNPGNDTRFLIEEIPASVGQNGQPITEILTCVISNGEAYWTRTEDIIINAEQNTPIAENI